MSENLNFSNSDLSSILNLISLNNDGDPIDTAYEQVQETLTYTDQLISECGLSINDDNLFEEDYRLKLEEIEKEVQAQLIKEKSVIDSSTNDELNDLIETTDLPLQSFESLVSIARQEEKEFEYIIPQDLGAISIEEIDDIPGQVIVTSVDVNTNETIAEHTFNVRLKGQLSDDIYKFDKVPFTNEYVLKDTKYVLKDNKPRLIAIDDDKIGRLTLHYDYVFEKAGEDVVKTITRYIKFIDVDGNEIDTKLIPENDEFTETLTFEGKYNSDGSVSWKVDTQFFTNIPMSVLNDYLKPFGFVKTGPDIGSTKVFGNTDETEIVEFVKVKSLVDEEVHEVETINENRDKIVDVTQPAVDLVEEIKETKKIDELKIEQKEREHKRAIQFKLIDTDELIHETIEQTKLETYSVDQHNNRFDVVFSEWTPSFDEILNELNQKYEFKEEKEIDVHTLVVYFEKKVKLTLDTIYDVVMTTLDKMPSSLASHKYEQFKSINEILAGDYSNENLMLQINYRYNDRMLNNINQLRKDLGLKELENFNLNGVALEMFINDVKYKHYQDKRLSYYVHSNFDVLFEDNLYNKNFVGYGRDFSPEALADYIFKNILYEANYIFEGDRSKWEHLNNLVKTKGKFVGLLYVEKHYKYKSEDETWPYKDITKFIYKLSVSNKYVLV